MKNTKCDSRIVLIFFTSQTENYVGEFMLFLCQGTYFNLTERDNVKITDAYSSPDVITEL